MKRWNGIITLLMLISCLGGVAESRLNLRFDATGALCAETGGKTISGGIFAADLSEPATTKPRELVPDGGLEGDLSLWHIGEDWTVDDHGGADGGRALRIDWPEAGRSDTAGIRIPVRPGTPYRARVRIKGAGATPYFAIRQLDAAGEAPPDYAYMTLGNDRAESDWFELSYDVFTQPFCRELDLYVEMWEEGLPGTAWVDDFSLVELTDDYLAQEQPVTGTVSDGVLTARACEDMALEAVCLDRGTCWEIQVRLNQLRQKERAASVSVRLSLPEEREWKFFRSLDQVETPVPGEFSGSSRLYGDRRLVTALPLAAVGDGETGLALAVPMDQPRLVQLGCESGRGLVAEYEFGFSPNAGRYAGAADFTLYVYAFDCAGGFRAALEKYYRLFPQFFERRLVTDGTAAFTRGNTRTPGGRR